MTFSYKTHLWMMTELGELVNLEYVTSISIIAKDKQDEENELYIAVAHLQNGAGMTLCEYSSRECCQRVIIEVLRLLGGKSNGI